MRYIKCLQDRIPQTLVAILLGFIINAFIWPELSIVFYCFGCTIYTLCAAYVDYRAGRDKQKDGSWL